MNIYTYEVTLVVGNDDGSDCRRTIYPGIKATSELNAVVEVVKSYAPVYEIIRVGRVQ